MTMNNPPLLLHVIHYLLLTLILPLTTALPAPTAAPKLLCTTTAQSPAASLLKSVMALYTQSCQTPASVPASRACVTLAQSAERGYVVSLCGWGAGFGTCADAEAAVGALVDGCAEGGGAEGQLAGGWGTVVVGRVVGRTDTSSGMGVPTPST